MSERPDPADGLGRSSAGTPGFAQPAPQPTPRPVDPVVPGGPPQLLAGPPSRWPTLLTVAVVAIVVAVTAVATLVARHADTHVTAPAARSRLAVPSASAATDGGSIDFTSAHGTGRLVVRDRRWVTGSPVQLRVSVELACVTGTVDYTPSSFQLFDAGGKLVEPSPGSGGAEIGFGTLRPGEQVRGEVVFEVARQVVTLVLNDNERSVTALRIAD